VVEGYAELALALGVDVRPRTLVTCPDLVDGAELPLVDRVRATGAEVVTMSRAAFAKASYRESPDGWLAVVPNPERPLSGLTLPATAPLVLVAESVEKPGNLGAMLRTAEAAGVHAVIAASAATDWGNPNVVRASKGTVFAVPIASAPTSESAACGDVAGPRAHPETRDREDFGGGNQETVAVRDGSGVNLRDVGGVDEPLHDAGGASGRERRVVFRRLGIAHRNLRRIRRRGRGFRRRARPTKNAVASPAARSPSWMRRVGSVIRSRRVPDPSSTRTPAGRFQTSPPLSPGSRSRNDRVMGTSMRPRWEIRSPWRMVVAVTRRDYRAL